jgi:hypothetical protein
MPMFFGDVTVINTIFVFALFVVYVLTDRDSTNEMKDE